ncbi:MAG: putative RNA uridine N3 methyltransferase [Candidatus Bathyarchaeia archaeon]
MNSVESVLVAFGSPRMGLPEILGQECRTPNGLFHFFVNSVSGQQVATVRTEEALFITLVSLTQ